MSNTAQLAAFLKSTICQPETCVLEIHCTLKYIYLYTHNVNGKNYSTTGHVHTNWGHTRTLKTNKGKCLELNQKAIKTILHAKRFFHTTTFSISHRKHVPHYVTYNIRHIYTYMWATLNMHTLNKYSEHLHVHTYIMLTECEEEVH